MENFLNRYRNITVLLLVIFADSPDREISTIEIGEYLMDSLKEIDKIAYVRFASVYRDFQDEEAFFNELKNLMRHKSPQ